MVVKKEDGSCVVCFNKVCTCITNAICSKCGELEPEVHSEYFWTCDCVKRKIRLEKE